MVDWQHRIIPYSSGNRQFEIIRQVSIVTVGVVAEITAKRMRLNERNGDRIAEFVFCFDGLD